MCFIARITEITTFDTPDGLVSFTTLEGQDERGNRRVVVARGANARMFPAFLQGYVVRVVCRPDAAGEWRTLYNFLELAHVAGLTERQETDLWPWRVGAYRLLRDGRVQMSAFEESVCRTVSLSGRPPSLKQRAILARISEREPGATRDSLWRAERHRPRENGDGSASIGEVLLQYLAKLHEIWLSAER